MLRRLSLMVLVAAAVCAGSAFGPAHAEEWRTIDCANSKIAGPPGLNCGERGPVHIGGCREMVSVMAGNIDGRFMVGFLRQSSNCFMPATSLSGFSEEAKALLGPLFKDVTWDAPRAVQQQYVLTGRSHGRACVAFGIYGPPMERGHRYVLLGGSCKPEGQATPYTDDEIRGALTMFAYRSV